MSWQHLNQHFGWIGVILLSLSRHGLMAGGAFVWYFITDASMKTNVELWQRHLSLFVSCLLVLARLRRESLLP